jgi:hypothetical protein
MLEIEVIGKAVGGKARANSLTPEKRSEIAKNAAAKRWTNPALKATHGDPSHPLKIGDLEIPCYVLEDGRRVLSLGGMVKALGMSIGSAGGGEGDRLASFASGKSISPFISKDLASRMKASIKFQAPTGGTAASGYEATILPDLCDAVLSARKAGALRPQQLHVGEQCEILVRGFARVGIIALVDEATGYQSVRPADALQAYLEQIISKELAAWVKKFPDEFYENIYKLRGWTWPGMGKNRYSVVGTYTRDLVFERIAPGLLPELERKSPKNEKGHRSNKLHQWLTEDIGDPMLAQHMHSLIMFQRLALASGFGWNRFVKMVDQVMPKRGNNLELPLDATDSKV